MARRTIQVKEKKPLIVICSEGGKKSSEYYYFRNFSSRELRVQFSTGNSTDPEGMFQDLMTYIDNEDIKSEDKVKIFLLIDTDLNDNRLNKIKKIEEKCRKKNIEIITSSPTFEIWFLIHFRDNKLIFNSSSEVKKEIKTIIPLYNETMNVYDVINDKTDYARRIAKSLEQKSKENSNDLLHSNPHSSIYKVLDAIDEFNKKKD